MFRSNTGALPRLSQRIHLLRTEKFRTIIIWMNVQHRISFEPYPDIQDRFKFSRPGNFDNSIGRLTIRKQIDYLLRYCGQLSLQSKKMIFSEPLKQARAHTIHLLVNDSIRIGNPIRSLYQVRPNKVMTVIQYWAVHGASPATIRTRVSHLNWLFASMLHPKRLNTANVLNALGIKSQKVTVQDPVPDEGLIQTAIQKAGDMDRFVGIQLKLIYFLGLSPAEAISLRPRAALAGNTLALTGEGTPKPIKIFGPLTEFQIQIVKEAAFLAHPFKIDRLRLPESSFFKTRNRLYYISRLCGFQKNGINITPVELSKLRKSGSTPS